MKIKIKSNNTDIRLWLPSVLIFNPVVATLAGSKMLNKICGNKAETKISPKAVRRLFREINRCRRRCKNWTFVDVHSSDGTEVNVRL